MDERQSNGVVNMFGAMDRPGKCFKLLFNVYLTGVVEACMTCNRRLVEVGLSICINELCQLYVDFV